MSIQAGRRVVPTELGITLVRGYQLIDQELCLPQVRASCTAERPLRSSASQQPAWRQKALATCLLARLSAWREQSAFS